MTSTLKTKTFRPEEMACLEMWDLGSDHWRPSTEWGAA